MIHHVPVVQDRRELDDHVRRIYDQFSSAGERMARHHYAALIRGGANALHRYGQIIVPRVNDDQPHVIKIEGER